MVSEYNSKCQAPYIQSLLSVQIRSAVMIFGLLDFHNFGYKFIWLDEKQKIQSKKISYNLGKLPNTAK